MNECVQSKKSIKYLTNKERMYIFSHKGKVRSKDKSLKDDIPLRRRNEITQVTKKEKYYDDEEKKNGSSLKP